MRAKQGKKVERMMVKIGRGKEIKGMKIREAKKTKSKKMKGGLDSIPPLEAMIYSSHDIADAKRVT